MRIIHCADIHIGSAMHGVANSNLRRDELITALSNMVEQAVNSNVEVVLIAGDMIDTDGISSSQIANIASILGKYAHIQYYIVKGNHGSSTVYDRLMQYQLDNVHYFGEKWTTYKIGNVAIHGIELVASSNSSAYNDLVPIDGYYNIALLHADTASDAYGAVDVDALLAKCQYTALGHIHSYKQVAQRNGHVVVYSGVLECRGFDELGGSGYVLLDTDTGKHSHIPMAIRTIASHSVDISNITSEIDVVSAIRLLPVDASQYLNISLVGSRADTISIDSIRQLLDGRYFALRISDNTSAQLDIDALLAEQSLRGNTVAKIMSMSMQDMIDAGIDVSNTSLESIRNDLVRICMQALEGETISW